MPRELNSSPPLSSDQGQDIDATEDNSSHTAVEEGSFAEVEEHSESMFSLKPSEEYNGQPKGKLPKNLSFQDKVIFDDLVKARIESTVRKMSDDTCLLILQLDGEGKLGACMAENATLLVELVSDTLATREARAL